MKPRDSNALSLAEFLAGYCCQTALRQSKQSRSNNGDDVGELRLEVDKRLMRHNTPEPFRRPGYESEVDITQADASRRVCFEAGITRASAASARRFVRLDRSAVATEGRSHLANICGSLADY